MRIPLVGQVVDLRRVGNPPAAQRRLPTGAQDAILPHNLAFCVGGLR